MLRTALQCVASMQFFIVTSAVAAPVAFIWHDGIVATTPYYNGGFTPATGRSINDSGLVAGALTDGKSFRTAATWDGNMFMPLQMLSGYDESTANGLNNGGTIVGASLAAGRQQPTAWINGQPFDLGLASGYTGGLATAINGGDQSVGLQYRGMGYDAALWASGGSQILPGLPGASQTEATSINSSGTIAGISGNTAVVWRNGVIETMPGCSAASGAYAINDAGQVAGRCGSDAVLWQNGVMTVVGPGLAVGISDAAVVARSNDDPLQSQTYIWTTSSMQELAGFQWSQPFASSSNGYIVGFGDQVPEPATFAICLVGFFGLLLSQAFRQLGFSTRFQVRQVPASPNTQQP